MHKFKLISNIVLTVLCLFLSVLASAFEPKHIQESEVGSALTAMLAQEKDPFVVITITGSEKFIQFYNNNPGLLLDLPLDGLSESEKKKATAYFSSHGISLTETRGKNPETDEEFSLYSWGHVFDDREVEKVVKITIGALIQIFGLSADTSLTIEKGWEWL